VSCPGRNIGGRHGSDRRLRHHSSCVEPMDQFTMGKPGFIYLTEISFCRKRLFNCFAEFLYVIDLREVCF